MIAAHKQNLPTPLKWLGIASGGGALIISVSRLSVGQIDVPFLLLALVAINIGTRITIKIPHVRGQVSLSDTFVFLAMLLFAGEGSVILAAVAALCASLRFSRERSTLLFNSAIAAASTFVVLSLLRYKFGTVTALSHGNHSSTLILAVGLIALVQSFIHSGIVALSEDEETAAPVWRRWGKNFFWTGLTYFTVAASAAVIAKLVGVAGFLPSIAATTVLAIAHFVYGMYLKDIYASVTQARQMEQQVATLQESEELFRSAFDFAAIGMALVSTKGRWLQVNRSLCDILGYTEEELLATNFQQFTHPDDLGTALSQIKQLLKGKIPSHQMEKRYLHKQGHAVWVLWSVSRVRETHTGM
ncbi:MAG: hypothetical protein QOE47_1989, partial [Pyrinomonadaceae bacterium]|nr:hypothetical protein [Pyrinomonadaceae bacterium]